MTGIYKSNILNLQDNYMNSNEITKIFKALGDSNRMTIFQMLMEKELNASEILAKLNITQPTLSHHMKLLTDSGVISSRRAGNATLYSINKNSVIPLLNKLNNISSPVIVTKPVAEKPIIQEQEANYQNKLLEIAREARREHDFTVDFLMRMSHDLRTPVNSIQGMILMARKNANDSSALEVCLSKMEEATCQLERLLDEAMDMGEINSSKDFLTTQSYNIFENAREMNKLYEQKLKKAGLILKCQADGEILHPFILSNKIYIRRMFQIIMDNAIKYSSRNGTIYISFKELSYTDTTTTHQIKIFGTGQGMPKEFANNVFEPFDSEKSSKKGWSSGISLSVVKQLLDRINGKIEIETDENTGTIITLEMTFKIDKKAEELSEKTNPTDISGKRILLVEDNDLNLEVAQFILSDAGAYVIPAKNGKEAVEIVKNSAEGEFDLILMDLIMPVMNGYAATKIIRSMERKDTSIVPIIAMSANTFEQDIQKSLDSGMNEHISKPLNVEKLLTVLNKWIKK